MIRVTGISSSVSASGSSISGTSFCAELPAVWGEGVGGRDARLLSVGG